MFSVLPILILLKGRCWPLLGTEIAFPCSYNSSAGALWCWLSQEATPRGSHQNGTIFPDCLAHGSLLQRGFVLCWFCSILLVKHASNTPSVLEQEDGCMLAPTFFSSICQSQELWAPRGAFSLCSCPVAALDGTFLEDYVNVTCLLI